MTKRRPWHKRNRDVILFIFGVLITLGTVYYTGAQYASGVIAIGHQNSALHNGVNSSIVQLSNGLFSNSDSVAFHVTTHLTANIDVFIRCNNSTTYNGTGPFTCPDAVQ